MQLVNLVTRHGGVPTGPSNIEAKHCQIFKKPPLDLEGFFGFEDRDTFEKLLVTLSQDISSVLHEDHFV